MEIEKEIQQAMQVGVGAPTKRISKRNSTSNASWGGAPTKNFKKKFNKQCKLGLIKNGLPELKLIT